MARVSTNWQHGRTRNCSGIYRVLKKQGNIREFSLKPAAVGEIELFFPGGMAKCICSETHVQMTQPTS